jgi:hypothetical protein
LWRKQTEGSLSVIFPLGGFWLACHFSTSAGYNQEAAVPMEVE